MKSTPKTKIIILITLGILFALTPLITVNPSLITNTSDVINLDTKNLKISAVSGKIHIIGNSLIADWTDAKNAGIVTGKGTYSEPYIIEDLVIDAGGSGSGIFIERSDVYFRIENCTVYNSQGDLEAGIRLEFVSNGSLINNNVSNNRIGISLFESQNNTISGNIANNNNQHGIYLTGSEFNIISGNAVNNNTSGIFLYFFSNHNVISGNTANNNFYEGLGIWTGVRNVISGNTANNNSHQGISLGGGYFNTISGNTANNNEYGLYFKGSDDNVITGNILIGNNECIVEEDSTGNKFSDNGACTYGQGPAIPGYNLFFLFSTLFAAVILLRKKLRNS